MRSAQRCAFIAALAALFAVAVATTAQVRWAFFNSDLLFPAAYSNVLLHHPGLIRFFNLPRVPSFFPDILAVSALSAVIGSWRIVSLTYAALSFTALVLTAGLITARLANRPYPQAAAIFLALAAAAMSLDLQWNDAWGAYFYILFPTIHSGGLIASLWGLLLVRRFIDRPSPALGLGIATLAALCTFSDRLAVGIFALPAAAGTLLMLLPAPRLHGRAHGGRLAQLLAILTAGCLAGFLVDRLLFRFLLLRDPDVSIDIPVQLARLPALLHEPSIQFEAACTALILIVPARHAWRSPEGRFWWAATATASIGSLALLPLVYADYSATRYAQPVWWWAIIIGAAILQRAAPRAALPATATAAAICLAAAAPSHPDLLSPSYVTNWADPLEQCLTRLHAAGEIHAGAAQYWVARPIEASSNWTRQVVQITENGWAYPWENDLSEYGRSLDAPGPPHFDFLVTTRLDKPAMAAHFGPPDRTAACPGADIWIYADPDRFRQTIVGADSWARRDHLLDTPARFGPNDFFSAAGRLPATGLVPPTPDVASWGPHVPLSPGRWRLTLDYDLTNPGPTPAEWQILLNPEAHIAGQGPLQPGDNQTERLIFEIPRRIPSMELRSLLPKDARLTIHGMTLNPLPPTSPPSPPGRGPG